MTDPAQKSGASKQSGKAAPAKPARAEARGGDLGFEAELFKAADKLRGNMEPSDYKHVALGLIFLKHISDSFEAKRARLLAEYPEGAEDRDEYAADNDVIHQRGPGRSFEAVEFATLKWVNWFNNRRLFEPLCNSPPAEAEANYYASTAAMDKQPMAA
jgi:hypothetical protein